MYEKEIKDVMESLKKNLIKSNKYERLLINNHIFLKKIVEKLLNDNETKKSLKEVKEILFKINESQIALKDEIDSLNFCHKRFQSTQDSLNKLLIKLDAQQIWLFENIDDYVGKAIEKILLLKERNND